MKKSIIIIVGFAFTFYLYRQWYLSGWLLTKETNDVELSIRGDVHALAIYIKGKLDCPIDIGLKVVLEQNGEKVIRNITRDTVIKTDWYNNTVIPHIYHDECLNKDVRIKLKLHIMSPI